MKRVVVMTRKDRAVNQMEVFSNLKILCASYPAYNYNTLNNYLCKNKMAYENEEVRIERKLVNTAAIPATIPGRKMAMVARRVKMHAHDDKAEDLKYWLSRPVKERLEAVTRLSAQFKKKGQRMDRTHLVKRKLR